MDLMISPHSTKKKKKTNKTFFQSGSPAFFSLIHAFKTLLVLFSYQQMAARVDFIWLIVASKLYLT